MTVPSSAPVTAALVALVASATSRPVGDGRLPTAADPPFAVVYGLPGGESWGPDYTDPQAATALAYQITYVSVTRAGAEAFADIVRHALLDRSADGAFVTALAVSGLTVLDRELLSYGGLDSDRGVFNIRDTFQVHVTT
jgi:hypothetical protein